MIKKSNPDTLKKKRDFQSLHGKVPAVSEHVEELLGYSCFRAEVTSTLADAIQTKAFDNDRIHHLLNGGASKALQEHVAREARLKFGMFFSGQRLASSVADMIQHKILQGAVLADPACGAGDLLLACLSRAPIHGGLQSTLTSWGERTRGLDIHEELAGTARVRISSGARKHLSTVFSAGAAKNTCCAGSIVIDLKTSGLVPDIQVARVNFVKDFVPTPLCGFKG